MVDHGRDDATLKLPTFHGTRRDYAKQHWFTYEVIWVVKKIQNDWKLHLDREH